MDKIAMKILDLLDDVRYTKHDLDYLAFQLVYNAPRPIRTRLLHLADAIIRHDYEIQEQTDNDYLF